MGCSVALRYSSVLIQHNPNEGLKPLKVLAVLEAQLVLIQHNPNEGLKLAHEDSLPEENKGAHSAQPERGIET